jgi:hypothetical protein
MLILLTNSFAIGQRLYISSVDRRFALQWVFLAEESIDNSEVGKL